MSTKLNQSKPIVVAIIANSIIAISKAVGYFFSGSSALLSETIHSIADVMNQALLLVGIKRGSKEENSQFHYGYSQERFFWNLVSAMGIFVLGCGVTVYHGVHDLLHPSEIKPKTIEQYIILIILFISLLVESYSFYVASKEISEQAIKRNKNFFEYLNESTDPSVSAVFWEDLAAIIGILLAFFGILLTAFTGNNIFDAGASILIGLLMGWIAYHLASENKKFLIDRAIPDFELQKIILLLKSNSSVKNFSEVRTIVLGPDNLKFSAKVELDSEKIIADMKKEFIEKLKNQSISKAELDGILTEFAGKIWNAKVKELETMKSKFKNEIPELKYIDLTI